MLNFIFGALKFKTIRLNWIGNFYYGKRNFVALKALQHLLILLDLRYQNLEIKSRQFSKLKKLQLRLYIFFFSVIDSAPRTKNREITDCL